MRMYAIKKENVDVAVVRANTPNQALNIYARRTKTEIDARCIDATDVYDLVVKGGLPVYEPENNSADPDAGKDDGGQAG